MTTNTATPARILCVDDEAGILRTLKRILRSEPVQVATATSGEEALTMLRNQPVDLILTDYRMPEMNGVEFLEQAITLCPEAFRIIVTGYAEAGALIEAINRGQIYKILYKPFQEEDVRLSVRSALEHHARNQENAQLVSRLAEQNQQLEILNRQLENALAGKTTDLKVSTTALTTTQQLLDQLDIAIMALDSTGQIVLANRRADEWFGHRLSLHGVAMPLLGTWAAERLPQAMTQLMEGMMRNGQGPQLQPVHLTLRDDVIIRVRCQRMDSQEPGDESESKGFLLYADEARFSMMNTSP
jgi:two-component system NtrC family sensor kinase